ncbi:MAG: helicase HerA domain-containing protein, partial [Pirellulaceae bacterium]
MQDYEKLGAFFLGRELDLDTGEASPAPLLYDSKDLTTHAVVVGMTGSGKTGLCLDLLEEAGLDRIPAIVIDPKGDISNLLLTFPALSAQDFRPWIDESQASREGMSPDEFAAEEAAKWRKGLKSWGQTGDRIRKFRDSVDLQVFTPG